MTTSTTTCPLLQENQSLIDSLGYIDTEYNDPATQQVVQHLIRAEMTKFRPDPDTYLAYLPDYTPTFAHNPRLQKEYKRVSAKVRLNAIDMNRYYVQEPTGKRADDLRAWEQAVRRMQIALEHQNNRVTNLELQHQYGANVWKVKAAVLDGLNAQFKHASETTAKAIDATNSKRKEHQQLNASKLQQYMRKCQELLDKTRAIKRACDLEETRRSKRAKTEASTSTATSS